MRVIKIISAVALGAFCLAATASAQTGRSFDAGKFFEEINNRGVNTKGIDGYKFFEDIANRGVSSNNPIDGNKFFEELSNRGVNTAGFDGNKFFEELSNRGVSMPDMVTTKPASK